MSPRVVKRGEWFYAGVSPIQVRIEEVDVFPGSGDHEDAEEVREDKMGLFYYVSSTAAGSPEFKTGRGYFTSVAAAVIEAERAFPSMAWKTEEGEPARPDNAG